MALPGIGSINPEWKRRLTLATPSQNVSEPRGSAWQVSVASVISAERLVGVKVGCPRCDAPAATVWRRFDFLGPELPLYFTKCRRCLRRRWVDADEAAFRLLEAGVADPVAVIHEGIPVVIEEQKTHSAWERSGVEVDAVFMREAKRLLANRQCALGKKHPLTFAARAQLAEAVGKSGDAQEAAQVYQQLLHDQVAAEGNQSPAVLANRYRAAVWTADAGKPWEALESLRSLLADEELVVGPDHANNLIIRATIAQLIDMTGDRDHAIEMFRVVAQDQLRVLGSEHPATEASLRTLAEWEGR